MLGYKSIYRNSRCCNVSDIKKGDEVEQEQGWLEIYTWEYLGKTILGHGVLRWALKSIWPAFCREFQMGCALTKLSYMPKINWCQSYKPQNTVKLQKNCLLCNKLDIIVLWNMLIYVKNALAYYCKITKFYFSVYGVGSRTCLGKYPVTITKQ